MSTMNATTCKTMSQKMIRATILTRNSDSAATISMTTTLSHAMAQLLVRWLPALAMAVLWKTRPRPVSMNGVNCAAKCALVDRT